MAHDPSLGFADYFSAAAAGATEMDDDGAPELYGMHADMEYLGMRGLAAMPAAAHHHHHHHGHVHSKAGALVDDDAGAGPDGDGSTDDATMRFLSEQQHQTSQQAPLSLSLCRPDGVGGVGVTTLHEQQLGVGSSRHHHHQQQPGPAAWMQQQHDYSPQPQHAWHLRGSRFLVPAQQVLQEFCSLPVDSSSAAASSKRANAATKPSSHQQQQEDVGGGEGSSSSASWAPSPQIQAMDALELQRLKDKLYIMLEEVSSI